MENLLTQQTNELVALLLGFTMLLVGAIRYARQSAWLSSAKETKGRIVALEKVFVETESHYGVYERPVFRYDTTRETKVGSISHEYLIGELSIGEEYPLLYNARTPGRIVLEAVGNYPLFLSFGLAFIGTAVAIIALALI